MCLIKCLSCERRYCNWPAGNAGLCGRFMLGPTRAYIYTSGSISICNNWPADSRLHVLPIVLPI